MADRAPAAHARHDSELVPGCRDCDALAPDLAAISVALASFRGGADSGHRDFRITTEDAERLRRGRGIRAWLRPLAGPRLAFARPLGGTLTVVAFVGLLASSLPIGGLAAGGALEVTGAGSPTGRGHETEPPRAVAAPASSPTAGWVFDSLSGSPKASVSGEALVTRPPTDTPSNATGQVPQKPERPASASGLLLASLVLLPIGLLLVVGRGIARRLIGAAREP